MNRYCIMLAGLLFSAPLWAQSGIIQTGITHTTMSSIDIENSNADQWGLDDTQWESYKELMNGEAGLYYRHLEPAFVLGIYAETDQQRVDYAKKLYAREKQRLDKLLSFNRVYLAHSTSVDGNTPMLDKNLVNERKTQLSIAPTPLSTGVSLSATNNRYVVFVERNCTRCDTAVKRLVDARRRFEIYYSGATATDEIRRWASSLKIPKERVTNGDISLNFDSGYSKALGIKQYPTIYKNIRLEEKLSVDEAVNNVQ